MASVINERDVLLQGSTTRVVDVSLPDNILLPAFRAVTLSSPGATFRVAADGSSSPTAITVTADLKNIAGTPTMSWSVTPSGAATLTGTSYGVRTLSYANMTQDFCTVRVEVTDGGMIYTDELSFAKARDGSKGLDGRGWSFSVSRAVTTSAWSDAQALQALVDAGGAGTVPMETDTVTLYNASTNYAEMRRYDGKAWSAVGSSLPGSVLMNGTIVTEKLLVTGLGIALNPDPNTQDISAWTGTGLSIVTDATSPSGSAALECTGLAATVLSKKFPIDPTKNYKARIWTKQQSGMSTTYLTVAFYDASGTVISGTSNGTGWKGKGSYHYFGLSNGALPTAWTEYSVSFGPNEAAVLPSNARFMAIGVLSNYLGTGVQRVAAPLVHLKTTGDMVVDGTLTASKIDTRGLSIKDANGNVILAAGTALDWSNVGGTGKPADGATVGADASNLKGFGDSSNLISDIYFEDPSWGAIGGDWAVNSPSVISTNLALRYVTGSKTSTTSSFLTDKVTPSILLAACSEGETLYFSNIWATDSAATGTWAIIARFYDKNKVVLTAGAEVYKYLTVPQETQNSVEWAVTVPTGAAYVGYRVRRGSSGSNSTALGWCEIGNIRISRSQSGATLGATFGVNISGKILRSNASTFIESAAINTALIDQLAVTDAKIADLSAEKITAGTISAGRIDVSKLSGVSYVCAAIGNTTFTVPADYTTVRVTLVGAGGGGGGGSARRGYVGGGGGSGGVATATFNNRSPGEIVTVNLGYGGSGGGMQDGPYSPAQSGAAGSSSHLYISGQHVLSADGGSGGSGGDMYIQGGAGGAGGLPGGNTGETGDAGALRGGNGASSPYGAGGAGQDRLNSTPAFSGSGYGSGGGGGGCSGFWDWDGGNYVGASGAQGYAIVEFYNPNSVVLRQELVDKGLL